MGDGKIKSDQHGCDHANLCVKEPQDKQACEKRPETAYTKLHRVFNFTEESRSYTSLT